MSGISWKAFELKRLAEIALNFPLICSRETFLHTTAEESLFHFLPNSSICYINPFQSFRRATWKKGIVSLPKDLDKEHFFEKQEWDLFCLDINELDFYIFSLSWKSIFSNYDICEEIQHACGVQLVPSSHLGLSPNTLVANMGLSNIGSLHWVEFVENYKVDPSFLYKHFWNCIDGAQKLMKYLNHFH